MRFIYRYIILCMFLLGCTSAFSEKIPEENGTLIVSYHTGPKGERLNRIRFLLSSNGCFENMYPKGNTYVEDEECPSRLVVIEDLAPGIYSLKFLVPNQDNLFEEVPEREVVITKGSVTKVDQSILPRDTSRQVALSSVYTTYPGSGRSNVIINQINAQLTVNSNLPDARWTLLRDNRVVYVGTGSVVNFQVPDGDKYTIIPEKIDGYAVRINQIGPFPLYAARTTRIDIAYERLTGSMTLQAPFPEGETVELKIISPDKQTAPLTIKLKSKGGKIFWTSQTLPTGIYKIFYILPSQYPPLPPEHVEIVPREIIKLSPILIQGSNLHVTANTADAIYLLKSQRGNEAWKGDGKEFTFQGIPSGTYLLSFATSEPDFFTPPADMRINLSDMETKDINVSFLLKGKLAIKSNIPKINITIQDIYTKKQVAQEDIQGNSTTISLPEGKYRVIVAPLQGNTSEVLKYTTPEPVDIEVKSFKTAQVNLAFKAENIAPETQAKKTNPTPPLKKEAIPEHEFASVPGGKAIVGAASNEAQVNEQGAKVVTISSFSIGIYEVTNEQFGLWLTEATKAGSVVYISEADRQGQVVDLEGHLLFKTFESDPYSQISAQSRSDNGRVFVPVAGKDKYPVINVSWYGAKAYCSDNQCRLPTEAEWEKAAANVPGKPEEPLKKFIYGFSKDLIDRTWANYKDEELPIKHFQVLTKPVGFYDGKNYLPLSAKSTTQQQVNLAKSPYGAFDMSGNVWEWVSDWFDDGYYKNMSDIDPTGPASGTQKVAKGGCYDSLADGVRVAERMPLPPEHADAFTGFRVVSVK